MYLEVPVLYKGIKQSKEQNTDKANFILGYSNVLRKYISFWTPCREICNHARRNLDSEFQIYQNEVWYFHYIKNVMNWDRKNYLSYSDINDSWKIINNNFRFCTQMPSYHLGVPGSSYSHELHVLFWHVRLFLFDSTNKLQSSKRMYTLICSVSVIQSFMALLGLRFVGVGKNIFQRILQLYKIESRVTWLRKWSYQRQDKQSLMLHS